MNQSRLVLEAVVATISRSPIVIASPTACFPAGYDEVDIAVLEWIAAEGRRTGRGIRVM